MNVIKPEISSSITRNTAKLIRANKGDMGIINVPENIETIFRPINLQRFIKTFETEDEAIKFLKLYG